MAVLILNQETLLYPLFQRKGLAQTQFQYLLLANQLSGFSSKYFLKPWGVKILSVSDTGEVKKWEKVRGYSIWKKISRL